MTTPRRRVLADRCARWFVTAGGLAIIASVLGILVFILLEVIPLRSGASVRKATGSPVAGAAPLAVATDEHRTHVTRLGLDGVVRVTRAGSGEVVLEKPLTSDPVSLVGAKTPPGTDLLTASTADGRILITPFRFRVSFEEDRRVVTPEILETETVEVDPGGAAIHAFAARRSDDDGTVLVAAQLADGTLVVERRGREVNDFTGEVTDVSARHDAGVHPRMSFMAIDGEQRVLYGGTERGRLLWWNLDDEGAPGDPAEVSAGPSAVTAITLLLGDRSLVVGQADGSLSVWFLVRQADQSLALTRIRDFELNGGPIRLIAPSRRNKSFLALDASGTLGLYHSTSHRTLWTGASPLEDASAMAFAPKGDGAVLASAAGIVMAEIDNPHPEVSLGALFGKVWYEGYERPQYVWQSSGGTDDFEPKLSLTPLLVGTVKGTIYSMFLAIPLGVLAAIYTSQFLHPSLRRFIKPAVEIMAALPSVVLGFLAGLWLAPRVERVFPALLLMTLVLPIVVLIAGFAWRSLPARIRGTIRPGSEVFVFALVVALGGWLCLELSAAFESLVFSGSFPDWLLGATGLRYDQRNAVVVGIAMGFAVIPIIFAIAEDALSNVPRNLSSGALALGASRWQTVARVVLPTASPGIFAGIIVGFGRAVGETMIVLMATGNTPIMDWNPFNGFRTLSANIAVEIPEAPHGGTLYRALFLAALLLFIVTFLVNTAAELIRQRLRRRYASL